MYIKLVQGQTLSQNLPKSLPQTLPLTDDKWNLSFSCNGRSNESCNESCNERSNERCNGDGTNRPLLSIKNKDKPIVSMYREGLAIRVSVWFDAKETPISLTGQMPPTGAAILICNTQNRIALYINDVLSDEDWPIGRVPFENSTCEVCCCADAALHDDFSLDQAHLSNQSYPVIHDIRDWVPAGHNTAVGDCMPFSHPLSHNGTFHLFYLFDRRGHQSKWQLGAHQWAHISTTDLMQFNQHPMAISIDDQSEGSICTGSVLFFNNLYYAFYAVRQCNHQPAVISYAVSEDCIVFKKSNVCFTLTEPYHGPSARDPMAFIDEDHTVHLLVTTSLIDENGTQKGCLAHLTSTDLVNWTQKAPFVVLDREEQPECPDYFSWNGFYYLIYSNEGYARYFLSKQPYGPWAAPKDNLIGREKGLRVPKSAAFQNNRRIVAGFVEIPEHGGYGGKLCLLEMRQQEDGTLTFVTPKEIASR